MTLTSELTFSVRVLLGPPLELGPTPSGFRRVIPIIGGAVSGDLSGVVVAGGADWNVVRDDGSVELSARYELLLEGGVVVSVTNTAELPAHAESPFLTRPTFEVGDTGPTALRTGVFVGVLQPALDDSAVDLDVYRLAVSR